MSPVRADVDGRETAGVGIEAGRQHEHVEIVTSPAVVRMPVGVIVSIGVAWRSTRSTLGWLKQS